MVSADQKLFFSYATVAPMSTLAYQASKAFLDDYYRIGPPEILHQYSSYPELLANEAAMLLGCDPSEITYIKNTTEGSNIAADVIPLNKGDEILVMGSEYGANLLPWLKQRQNGITVTVIKGTDNAKAYSELIASVSSRTKVVAISSAQFYDGFMPDLSELSALREKFGFYLVIDAAQSLGIRKIDLRATPVDFLVSGGQKYLQAGMGVGLMYVNKSTLPKLQHGYLGVRSVERFDETGYEIKKSSDRFQDGTQNLQGIVALHAALKQVNELGIDKIEAKNIELLHSFKACLNDYGIDFIDHANRQSNIISIRVDDPIALVDYLREHSAYIRPTKDVARLSFIHESKLEDVETLAKLTRTWLSSRS